MYEPDLPGRSGRGTRKVGFRHAAQFQFQCGVGPAFLHEPELMEGQDPRRLADQHDRDVQHGLPVDASNTSLAFAILPPGVPQPAHAAATSFVENATELLHRHGGRRYLSGWLGARDPAFWRSHHGHLYDAWLEAKRTLDPNGVLTSALLPA